MAATVTDRIIAPGAIQAIGDVLARHKFGRNLLMVCDDNTYMAVGERILATPFKKHRIEPHSLGRHVFAEYNSAVDLARSGLNYDGIIAVGSGTINDLAKYAAHQLGIPYICVATAASMNGYTSSNASLTHDRMKHSYTATPPVAVVADLEVIAAAPRRMARAGVGDTLCRTTVEADCLLSHYLFDTPYPRDYFKKMRGHEKALLSQASQIKEAAHEYLAALMTALFDAGDAMAEQQSSLVASQGEHMIAHTLETLYGNEVRVLHGELIAVTTITMGELQNKMLLSHPTVRPLPRDEATFIRIFGKHLGPDIAKRYAQKTLNAETALRVNERLQKEWPDMKRQLADVLSAHTTIMRAYRHANIPYSYHDIGVGYDRYNAAVSYAYLTRDRFTFLDLAQMMGRRVLTDD